jgi:hypothetical protein
MRVLAFETSRCAEPTLTSQQWRVSLRLIKTALARSELELMLNTEYVKYLREHAVIPGKGYVSTMPDSGRSNSTSTVIRYI